VIRVERRSYSPVALVIAASVIAALATLFITVLLVAFLGGSASSFARLMLTAAFRSPTAIVDIVALAAPLMLIGLASTLTFRVGLINLGAEGQVIAAALAALAVSAGVLPVPTLAMIPFAIMAGLITGALSVAAVAVLKLRLRVDEAVITTILNIVLVFALQLMAGAMVSSLPPIGSTQVLPIANAAEFPDWGYTLHRYLEPLVAVIACLLAFGLMRFTIWGLDIRATGGNTVAARFAGIHVNLVKLNIALLAGALLGLAGVGQVIAADGGSTASLTLGLGYAGITVAFLAALEPLGVIPAALFVSAVLAGIKSANLDMGVPLALASVTMALLLITALVAQGAVRYRLSLRSRSAA
jgi:general nucleoside transport system permease protein